jgi:uncharacterized membrane protein
LASFLASCGIVIRGFGAGKRVRPSGRDRDHVSFADGDKLGREAYIGPTQSCALAGSFTPHALQFPSVAAVVKRGSGRTDMANWHVIAGASGTWAEPGIRKIGLADIREALAKGVNDFLTMPTHLIFLCLIYPIVGVPLAASNALYLLYPLASGFALIGPFAAIGLYELSRRRELGMDTSWRHAFEVLRSPAMPSILALGLLLMVIFLVWLTTAQALYTWLLGPDEPQSLSQFLKDLFTTSRGWALIILGNGVGFIFAALVLSISAVSFPLLLDRDVGAAVAIHTSVRAAFANPVMMAVWGLVVAGLLVVGSLPFFIGLAIVMPVLGHATWHLYRKLVPDSGRASP